MFENKERNTVVMRIDPDLAANMLAASGGNRAISKARVAQYATDMRRGDWQTTHQGIAFDVDGVLKDGHHRLNAIIEAAVPVDMAVTFGLPKDATIFDRGYGRNLRQHLLIDEGVRSNLANNEVIAIARMHHAFEQDGRKPVITDAMVYEFLLEHEETLDTVYHTITGTGSKAKTRNASVGYAVFCALKCGVELGTLERFVGILATGFCDGPEEYAAVTFRNQLSNDTRRLAERKAMCCACQAAISDFVIGRTRRRAYTNTRGVYREKWMKEEKSNG